MSGYNFQDLTVLICDDSLQIRALLKTFLHAFGVRNILDAPDAEAAFEQMSQADVDLMITDWNMQPTSGLELVRRIRHGADSPNPYVPIIMLTGYTEVERVRTARDTGVSAFLAKPVSADSLYKRMVSLVDDDRFFVRSEDFFGPDRRFKEDPEFGGVDRRARTGT